MDTAKARTAVPEPEAPAYDGFMSYSHGADDLLAPRLQTGLQRFAKPWWKRRALKIFRDEASLSANPHLWSSITEALDRSDWFVLLLSPEAASSPWVNREVEYWLAHKEATRIVPVVTDGEFGWG
ncbi:MAG: toll/interleukin-1 receptor domain-containing protein, partial [Acidimicrobiia bacterium]